MPGPFAPLQEEIEKGKALAFQADILRLDVIKEFFRTVVLEKEELPSRATKESNFLEAWVDSVSAGGIELPKTKILLREMRERSAHVNGAHIDAIVKMLAPTSTHVNLGTPYDTEPVGFWEAVKHRIHGGEE
jgi:hypothetical protein